MTTSYSPTPPVGSTTGPTPTISRHPIRGALFGLLIGLGAALILIGEQVIALGTVTSIFVVVAGIALGLLWSVFGPAKGPKPTSAPTAGPVEHAAAPFDVATAEPPMPPISTGLAPPPAPPAE